MCAERPPGGDRDCAGNVRAGSGEHLGQLAEPGRRVTVGKPEPSPFDAQRRAGGL
jgi:hypothetical protein